MSNRRSRLGRRPAAPLLGLSAAFALSAVLAAAQTPSPVTSDNGPTLERATAEIRALPATEATGPSGASAGLKIDIPSIGGGDSGPAAPPRPANAPAKGPIWVLAPEPSPRAGRASPGDSLSGHAKATKTTLNGAPSLPKGSGASPADGTGARGLDPATLNPLAPFMQQWVGAHDLRVLEQAGVLPSPKDATSGRAANALGVAGSALDAGRTSADGDPRSPLSVLTDIQQQTRNPYLASVQPGLDALARLPSPKPTPGLGTPPAVPPAFTGQAALMLAPTPTPTPPPVIYVPPASDDAKYFKQLKKF